MSISDVFGWKGSRSAILLGIILVPLLAVTIAFAAQALNIVAASPTIGPAECRPDHSVPQCTAIPFDTSQDFAYQGNGFAQKAVSQTNYSPNPNIHDREYANDGYYGNGASWISTGTNSWLKIDLGRVVMVDSVTLGRDRNPAGYDDRDPGQFTIEVALSDNVYANGDGSNDGTEYSQVFDSSSVGFSGTISGSDTLEARFSQVAARYVKLTVTNYGTAIDEVEVFGVLDSDGDGVPDEDDQYPNSNTDPEVVIGECDSGVDNQNLDDGATFNDEIGAAIAGAKNHGQAKSATTKLANEWKKEGLISGKDKGTVTSC